MKNILFIVAIFGIVFVQLVTAQNSTGVHASLLIKDYYNIKDALVGGNLNTAAEGAKNFITTINGIEKDKIKETLRNLLVSDADAISQSNELIIQSEKFAALSINLYLQTKLIKRSPETIYQVYCPMKKAFWLSNSRSIKDPYYGSAMFTCGSIIET